MILKLIYHSYGQRQQDCWILVACMHLDTLGLAFHDLEFYWRLKKIHAEVDEVTKKISVCHMFPFISI